MSNALLQGILTGLGGFIAASGGFWLFLKRRVEAKDAHHKLIMGLAHEKIVSLGMEYIEKGFVTKDEYDDLIRYFYEPYVILGGDGSTERIMHLVQRLPLTLSNSKIAEIFDKSKIRKEDRQRDGHPPIVPADNLIQRKTEERRHGDQDILE